MKRILIIVLMLLVTACGSDELPVTGEQEQEPIVESNVEESTEEVEKELYINLLNGLLTEFDSKYELFDVEAGLSLYELLISSASEGADVMKVVKESAVDAMADDEKDVYEEFADRVIELEDTFSHIDWSD